MPESSAITGHFTISNNAFAFMRLFSKKDVPFSIGLKSIPSSEGVTIVCSESISDISRFLFLFPVAR